MEDHINDPVPQGCSCRYKVVWTKEGRRQRQREPNPRCTAVHDLFDEVVEHLLDPP